MSVRSVSYVGRCKKYQLFVWWFKKVKLFVGYTINNYLKNMGDRLWSRCTYIIEYLKNKYS